MIRSFLKKTLYDLFKGKQPNIIYFYPFGCKYFMLNSRKDNLEEFDVKSDETIFLGYPSTSKLYKVLNKEEEDHQIKESS